MSPEDIRFSILKEDRDWYYVEYVPPNEECFFSSIHLVVVKPKGLADIAEAMEAEAKAWVARYNMSSMVTAFNAEEETYDLTKVRSNKYLLAWIDSNQIALGWSLNWPDTVSKVKLTPHQLEETFFDIPFKTGFEIQKQARRNLYRLKVGWWVVFVWAVVVPLLVAVVEWWSDLLGYLVLGYAFFKAFMEALRLTEGIPKSEKQRAKEAEELRMQHHHYHCERNPEAFNKLKAENLGLALKEATNKEALALKAKASERP